jgi:hypothetical protein
MGRRHTYAVVFANRKYAQTPAERALVESGQLYGTFFFFPQGSIEIPKCT